MNTNKTGETTRKKTIFLKFIVISIGIALLLALTLLCYLNFKEYKYSTAHNKRTISLKDGSEIVLNVNSTMSYNAGYGLINRKLTLTGEAFIRTRKKRYLPFVVKTPTAKVKVAGTLLNIKALEINTIVEVIEGKVTFSSLQRKGVSITVPEGFFSSCAASALPMKAKELAYSGYPEWMNNRFEYHNADMKSILAEMEAHFSIKVVVKGPEILKQKFSGVIEGACPEVVLQTLVVQIDRNMRFNENIYEIY